MKKLAAAVLGLAAITASASAQTTATVTDTRTITERPGMKPDTILIHAIAADGKMRIEHSAPLPGSEGGRFSATIEIMSGPDSDMVMTFIDTTKKVYAEMRPMGMVSAAMALTGMKMDDTSAAPTVDSIGAGPVINGHATLHFRTRLTSRMSMAMLGDSSVMTQTVTSDLFLAPDVKDIAADSTGPGKHPAGGGLGTMMPPGMQHMVESGLAVHTRLAKYGTALRTILETVRTTAAGTITTHQTIDVLRHDRMVVPDSVFLPPAGYKKVGLMDLMQFP